MGSTDVRAILADFFSEDALAHELDKGVRTIREWRRLCLGPPVTWIGRTPYYRIESVHNWLLSREKKALRAGRRSRVVAIQPDSAP
jgi:hypothetical protein